MSHEGIRFVNEAEARRTHNADHSLPREAIEPARVRVHKTEGTGMQIDWRDGHSSSWTFSWLREACPCATCQEQREADGRVPGVAKAQPASLLPMYKPPVRPETVTPVGRYAISFHWNDGHSSGIYSWDYLRRHCRCAECVAGEAGSQTRI
jgi:DUF971 family protein